MTLLEERRACENKNLEIKDKLRSLDNNYKVGDKLNVLYYKAFVGYLIDVAEIIELNPRYYDSGSDFNLKLSDGKTIIADMQDVEPFN